MSQSQFAHAVLHCNLNTLDLPASEAFYLDGLGLASRMRSVSTDNDATVMGLGPHTASTTNFLYDARGPRAAPALEVVLWTDPPAMPWPGPDDRPGIVSVGFRAADLDAVSRLPGARVGGSVVVRGEPRPVVTVVDPDGVTVEIVQISPAADQPEGLAFSHERIRCTDLDRTLEWYAAIGWDVCGKGGGGTRRWASIRLPEDPTFSLELVDGARTDAVPPIDAVTQGLYRMALAVDDVREAHAALVDGGMTDIAAPWFFPMPDTPTGGFTALFLADPDGVVVELVDRPRSAVRRPSEPR